MQNGATMSGNVDTGIYAADGTRLGSSGSTVQAGVNVVQSHTLSLRIPPGAYFVGISCSVFAYFQRIFVEAGKARVMGIYEQASAFPLPATATFAANTLSYIPTFYLNLVARPSSIRPTGLAALNTVHPMSWESIGGSIMARGGGKMEAFSSAVFPGANYAVLVPFSLSFRQRFQTMFAHNGGAVVGNIDLGVYDFNLNRIASTGSTAQSGTTTLQTISLDVTLGPGKFYMALGASSASAQFIRTTVAVDALSSPVSETLWSNSSAFPLPATFTPNQAPNYIPLFGLVKGTVI